VAENVSQGRAVREEDAEARPQEPMGRDVRAPVPKGGYLRRLGYVLLLLLLLAGAAIGYRWWQYSLVHESTDDAYVHGTTALISGRVPGTVTAVLVEDNRPVQRGDLLVRLDPTDYQVVVEAAAAAVTIARARLESAKLSVPYSRDQTAALVREAQARLAALRQTRQSIRAGLQQKRKEAEAAAANQEKAQKELRRVHDLQRSGIVATAELDTATATYKVAVANHEAALAAQQVEQEKAAATQHQMQALQAQIAQAETGNLSTRMRVFDTKSLQADLQQA
jgi:membrane fusion protein (multidrug efflux system)